MTAYEKIKQASELLVDLIADDEIELKYERRIIAALDKLAYVTDVLLCKKCGNKMAKPIES